MNIVIPMAGSGSRFFGTHKVSKPLIQVIDKPMIQQVIESLALFGKYCFVIRKDSFYDKIVDLLTSITPFCKIITVDYLTEGPACSALLADISDNEELIITNCDQIMWWDSELFLEAARNYKYDGMIVTYEADTPKNSYCLIDKKGFVSKVREKEVISNISLNGIHYWKKGSYFIESAKLMIDKKDTATNGEYYVGPTYNYMIDYFNRKVGIYHIPNYQHNPVGVPEDLDKYIKKHEHYKDR